MAEKDPTIITPSQIYSACRFIQDNKEQLRKIFAKCSLFRVNGGHLELINGPQELPQNRASFSSDQSYQTSSPFDSTHPATPYSNSSSPTYQNSLNSQHQTDLSQQTTGSISSFIPTPAQGVQIDEAPENNFHPSPTASHAFDNNPINDSSISPNDISRTAPTSSLSWDASALLDTTIPPFIESQGSNPDQVLNTEEPFTSKQNDSENENEKDKNDTTNLDEMMKRKLHFDSSPYCVPPSNPLIQLASASVNQSDRDENTNKDENIMKPPPGIFKKSTSEVRKGNDKEKKEKGNANQDDLKKGTSQDQKKEEKKEAPPPSTGQSRIFPQAPAFSNFHQPGYHPFNPIPLFVPPSVMNPMMAPPLFTPPFPNPYASPFANPFVPSPFAPLLHSPFSLSSPVFAPMNPFQNTPKRPVPIVSPSSTSSPFSTDISPRALPSSDPLLSPQLNPLFATVTAWQVSDSDSGFRLVHTSTPSPHESQAINKVVFVDKGDSGFIVSAGKRKMTLWDIDSQGTGLSYKNSLSDISLVVHDLDYAVNSDRIISSTNRQYGVQFQSYNDGFRTRMTIGLPEAPHKLLSLQEKNIPQKLIAAATTNEIAIYDHVASDEPMVTLRIASPVSHLSKSPYMDEPPRLLSGHLNGHVNLWDLRKPQQAVFSLCNHSVPVVGCHLLDSFFVIIAGQNSFIVERDIRYITQHASLLQLPATSIFTSTVSPDGKIAFATSSGIFLMDKDKTTTHQLSSLPTCRDLTWSTSNALFVGTSEGSIEVFSNKSRGPVLTVLDE